LIFDKSTIHNNLSQSFFTIAKAFKDGSSFFEILSRKAFSDERVKTHFVLLIQSVILLSFIHLVKISKSSVFTGER
jgi:hypothetical protein